VATLLPALVDLPGLSAGLKNSSYFIFIRIRRFCRCYLICFTGVPKKYGIGSKAIVNEHRKCTETPFFRGSPKNRNISEQQKIGILANIGKPVFPVNTGKAISVIPPQTGCDTGFFVHRGNRYQNSLTEQA